MGARVVVLNASGGVMQDQWLDRASPRWATQVMMGKTAETAGDRIFVGFGRTSADAQRKADAVRKVMVQ